jgi:hypothetical protein
MPFLSGGSSYASPLVSNTTTFRPIPSSSPKYTSTPIPIKHDQPPERFDFNQIFANVTGAGMPALAFAGEAPSRIAEMPLSAIDATAKKVTGFSPIKWIEDTVGSIPLVGDVVGRTWDVLGSGPQLVGSILNQRTSRLLRENANNPDETPISPLDSFMKGGMPWDTKTVGELRADALARGWTAQDFADLAAGKKSDFDFGDRRVNQNQIVDMALRIGLDPTNLVFGLGAGKWLAKGMGMIPEAMGLTRKLVDSGAVAETVADVANGARAIEAGNTAQGTLKGLGHYLGRADSYTTKFWKGSTALSAGVVGTHAATDWAAGVADGTPLEGPLRWAHELSDDILNDRPFSTNAAFMVISAIKMPYGTIVRDTRTAVRQAKVATFGHGYDEAFAQMFGQPSVSAWHEAMGGEERAKAFIARQIDSVIHEAPEHAGFLQARFRSAPEIGYRGLQVRHTFDMIRSDLLRRADPSIAPQALVSKFKRDYSTVVRHEFKPDIEDPLTGDILVPATTTKTVTHVRDLWDSKVALERELKYAPLAEKAGMFLRDQGRNVVLELRDTIPQEHFDDILAQLRSAGKGGLSIEAVRQVIRENRALLSLDEEYFSKFMLPSAPKVVPLQGITKKLAILQKDARPTREYLYEPASHEAAAPVAPSGESTAFTDEGLPQTPEPPIAGDIPKDRIGNLPVAWTRPLDDKALSGLRDFEDSLAREAPELTVGPAPKIYTLPDIRRDGKVGALLKQHTLVGRWLFDHGPLAPVTRFWDTLTSPVSGRGLQTAARQSLYDEMVVRGFTVKQADRLMNALQENQKNNIFALDIPWYHQITNMPRATIEKVARGVLVDAKGKPVKALENIPKGEFANILDRSYSRFARDMKAMAEKGGVQGSLGRWADRAYKSYQGSKVGQTTRMAAKVWYPLFRFTLDPRWWAMNAFEADTMALLSEGRGAVRGGKFFSEDVSGATYLHTMGKVPTGEKLAKSEKVAEGLALPPEEIQQMYGGGREKWINAMFDSQRLSSAEDVLNAIGKNDPIVAKLREWFGDEPETWAQQLDDTLYAFDKYGVKATVESEAAKLIDSVKLADMEPLLHKLYERNQQSFNATRSALLGNADRSNVQRVMNSYWLFWPLSYQLKAATWLYDAMTKRGLGTRTNLGLSAMYAHMYEFHKQHLVDDPEYAKVFADTPTAWFIAQMFLPITPTDLGVSLSRGPRYAGGEMGLWGDYKATESPAAFGAAMANMGFLYSVNLMQRLQQELATKKPGTVRITTP